MKNILIQKILQVGDMERLQTEIQKLQPSIQTEFCAEREREREIRGKTKRKRAKYSKKSINKTKSHASIIGRFGLLRNGRANTWQRN